MEFFIATKLADHANYVEVHQPAVPVFNQMAQMQQAVSIEEN